MRPAAILCAGGHGRTLAAVCRSQGREVFEYDDAGGANGTLATAEQLNPATWDVVIGLGLVGSSVRERLALASRFRALGFRLPPVVAEAAWLAGLTLGMDSGVQVLPGAVIGVSVTLGQDVVIGSGAVVEHDTVVAEGAFIGPGAVICGGVTVGRMAVIGAGAVVLPGVVVGEGSVVGAGAVVCESVAEGVTVVGCPARRMPETSQRIVGGSREQPTVEVRFHERADTRPVGAYAEGSRRAAAETERLRAAQRVTYATTPEIEALHRRIRDAGPHGLVEISAAELELLRVAPRPTVYAFREVSAEGARVQQPDGTMGPLIPHPGSFPCDTEGGE